MDSFSSWRRTSLPCPVMGWNIAMLLLLCSNDIELNPGPLQPLTRGASMEKTMIDMRKEVKEMQKQMEKMDNQMQEMMRHTLRFNLDEEIMNIKHELGNIREKSSIQMAFSKRQKTDLAGLEFEINSLKKVTSQNKTELKHLGNVVINDLKNLKNRDLYQKFIFVQEECGLHLSLIKREQADNEDFKRQVLKLKELMLQFNRDQKLVIGDLKNDFLSLKEFNRLQLGSLKHALETIAQEVSKTKNCQADFAAKADANIKLLQNQTSRLTEESNMHKSLNNNTKKEFDQTVDNFKKIVDSNNTDLARVRLELGKLSEMQKEMTASYATRIVELEKRSDCMGESVSDIGERVDGKLEDMDRNLAGRRREINNLQKKVDTRCSVLSHEIQQAVGELKTDIELLRTRNSNQQNQVLSYLEGLLSNEMSRVTKMVGNSLERMDELDHMYDDMQDRLFELDKNRKNNLVFYGVKGDETDQDECEKTIKNIMNTYMQVSREIPLVKVTRLWNGPSFRGYKPVQVSFQLWKDKEEILRKNNLLQKSTNMYVTEDFSRKVRRHREELIKFARDLRTAEPSVRCYLVYDRLYVENEIYLFNEGRLSANNLNPDLLIIESDKVEGRVERMLIGKGAQQDQTTPTPRGRKSRARKISDGDKEAPSVGGGSGAPDWERVNGHAGGQQDFQLQLDKGSKKKNEAGKHTNGKAESRSSAPGGKTKDGSKTSGKTGTQKAKDKSKVKSTDVDSSQVGDLGTRNIILEDHDVIMRYDGCDDGLHCGEPFHSEEEDYEEDQQHREAMAFHRGQDCNGHHQEIGEFEEDEDELRLAESMSLAVFLSLQQEHQDQMEAGRRRSVCAGIPQLETLQEASEESTSPSPAASFRGRKGSHCSSNGIPTRRTCSDDTVGSGTDTEAVDLTETRIVSQMEIESKGGRLETSDDNQDQDRKDNIGQVLSRAQRQRHEQGIDSSGTSKRSCEPYLSEDEQSGYTAAEVGESSQPRIAKASTSEDKGSREDIDTMTYTLDRDLPEREDTVQE